MCYVIAYVNMDRCSLMASKESIFSSFKPLDVCELFSPSVYSMDKLLITPVATMLCNGATRCQLFGYSNSIF